jgi:hypothetical protein
MESGHRAEWTGTRVQRLPHLDAYVTAAALSGERTRRSSHARRPRPQAAHRSAHDAPGCAARDRPLRSQGWGFRWQCRRDANIARRLNTRSGGVSHSGKFLSARSSSSALIARSAIAVKGREVCYCNWQMGHPLRNSPRSVKNFRTWDERVRNAPREDRLEVNFERPKARVTENVLVGRPLGGQPLCSLSRARSCGHIRAQLGEA